MDQDTTRFGPEICSDLDRALKLEWLETNALGGFSSSTIVGLNTRRYHGLLTAATRPPAGRLLLLSKFEETLVAGGRRYDLSANQYPGAVHPQGYQFMREFRLDPFPVSVYQVEGLEIEKRVFMVHGENTVVTEYQLRPLDGTPAPECFLELRPLVAFRDYHGTTHRNDAINPAVRTEPGLASVTPYKELPALFFGHNATELEESGHWYLNFEYAVERERGLDFQEDLFNPFVLRFSLHHNAVATVVASTEPRDLASAAGLKQRELVRRSEIVQGAPFPRLTAAADQFIVQRGALNTVIAGYHWFADWGRDTMIALPGLTLVTGRYDAARNILQAFADSADQGMLPNRFPDAGETPEYNTVDATLWFFEAIRSHLRYTGDYGFVQDRLYPKLKDIVDWHIRGTRYGIKVSSDGLLGCGEPGVQLTWMDAKVGDWVVTPRTGKPVEIQALWYNALRTLQDLALKFQDSGLATSLGDLAGRACDSFNAQFWNADAGGLYDVIDGDRRDGSIRPNQIFAASLYHRMLSPDRARQVVAVVERELYTPAGLRTLSTKDPRYRGRYQGGVVERDSAYHQGTVWPWLLGPFITAYVEANGRSEESRRRAGKWLDEFTGRLETYGLGQIYEIADGDPPHTPRGCIAQAWSVAELLRAAVEDAWAPPQSPP